MPDAIANLLAIMRDEAEEVRDRLNAAISASRVEKLQLPGEEPPESVAYLRILVDDVDQPTRFRREAAAALAYFERRSAKAALTFEVADTSEQRRQWTTIANAALRYRLTTSSTWPENRDTLGEADEPPANPDLTVAAMLMPARRQTARKRKALDDPGGTPAITSERDRRTAIMPLARICHERMAAP